ncbi:hypothetical protein F4802DRAFT_440587 [Xylaria palmicola]|nr:hypothetical protein F4802DRAFT_440587 [Xylaria palmicola]
MAIHPDLPGLEATVRCNGQALPEYEDPDAGANDDAANDGADSRPSTTKYIECLDGAEFDVFIKVAAPYQWGYLNHIVIADLVVDGQHIQGSVFRNPVSNVLATSTHFIKGRESNVGGTWSRQNFKFAAVKTIDDARKERVESDLKVAKDLGTIEVQFFREIEYGPSSHTPADNCESATFELAEKSLKGKAISHGTSYGPGSATIAPRYISTSKLAGDNGPILVIRFLYRSRDALKRELVIPRSPSLSPTLENLTPAERDRLARERLDELRNHKMKRETRNTIIKREFGEVFDLTEEPPAPRSTKKSRLQDGREVDVVDLTDD